MKPLTDEEASTIEEHLDESYLLTDEEASADEASFMDDLEARGLLVTVTIQVPDESGELWDLDIWRVTDRGSIAARAHRAWAASLDSIPSTM